MASARELAILTLTACEQQGAWSDGYLKKLLREHGLEHRDAALATRLCYGVLQNQMLIDWHLSRFCSMRLDKLEPNIRNCLRTAVYQLLYMEKIPPHAAVNESVKLARSYCRNPKAAGMVNGILRSMLRQMPLPLPEGKDLLETLSLRYSHPKWLTKEYIDTLGSNGAAQLLDADNQQPSITVQVNLCASPTEDVKAQLEAEGVQVSPHPWLPNCLILNGPGNLEKLSAYQRGWFYVQDCAARCAVTAAEAMPGQRLLDCCAAPGGKSFAAAIEMKNRGVVVSCDIHPHKIKLLETGRDRLGLSIIQPEEQSALQPRPEWLSSFDVVLADVPCSGLGVIRKKPDIRYKDPRQLEHLPGIQRRILDNVCTYVRPGGNLIYSTCTVLRRENEAVIEWFLAEHPDFSFAPFELPQWGIQDGMMTFWPHIHETDGFFIAKLRRRG